MGIADPLRTEHAELLPQLEALPAGAIGTEGSEDEVLAALDAALAFVHDSLIPHAGAEDAVLYPIVEQMMHAPGATATMSRDHVEVVRPDRGLAARTRLPAGRARPRLTSGTAAHPVRAVRHHPTALRQGRGTVPAAT